MELEKRPAGMSRRNFLRSGIAAGTVIAFDSLTAQIPYSKSLTKGFWEGLASQGLNSSADTLRKEVKTRYQVNVVGPETGLGNVKFVGEAYPTTSWDVPRLKALNHALSELPLHFYSPRIVNGTKEAVRFALVEDPISHCYCFTSGDQLIVFEKEKLEQVWLAQSTARDILFHELAHSVLTPQLDAYIKLIASPLGIESKSDIWHAFSSKFSIDYDKADLFTYIASYARIRPEGKGWVLAERTLHSKAGTPITFFSTKLATPTEALELLGEEAFTIVAVKKAQRTNPEISTFADLVNKAESDRGSSLMLIDIATEYLSLIGASNAEEKRLIHGTYNLDEFLAVGVEFYNKGRKKFMDTYSPIIGSIRTAAFYTGLKDHLFLGREYNGRSINCGKA